MLKKAGRRKRDDHRRGHETAYSKPITARAAAAGRSHRFESAQVPQEVWEKARDNPTLENFANLARQYSNDTNSGQVGGQIPPIQRHCGQPNLEKEAFSLKPGDLSSVVQAGENFLILFCEGYTEPVKIEIAEARKYIEEDLQEKKMRIAMRKEFDKLQENCTVDNYLAGTMKSPQSRKNVLKTKDPLDRNRSVPQSWRAPPDASPSDLVAPPSANSQREPYSGTT